VKTCEKIPEEARLEPITNILFNKRGKEYKVMILGNIYENKELLEG